MLISLATTTVGKRAIATCVIGGACYVAVCEIGKRFASYNKRKEARDELEAVKKNLEVLKYVSPALKTDRDFMLAAVKQNGWAFQFASANLKGDREIVLAAVNQDGWALKYTSAELKGDREIVLAAVNRNGIALKYASPALRDGELEDYIKIQLFLSNIFFKAKASNQLGLVPYSNGVLDKLPDDLGVTRLIAELAGVQVGERLGLIEGAATSLGFFKKGSNPSV